MPFHPAVCASGICSLTLLYQGFENADAATTKTWRMVKYASGHVHQEKLKNFGEKMVYLFPMQH